MVIDPDGDWVAYSDVPRIDKPAALSALIEYWQEGETHEKRIRSKAAMHKLAAQIIAEVEADI
jgi:uncharacterized protein YjaG (DUF416 family)